MKTSDGLSPGDQRDVIRTAVRTRPDAVLVSVGCLGLCSDGAVVLVGDGLAGDGRMGWRGPPKRFAGTDRSAGAAAVARQVSSGASSPVNGG